jgi:predicted dehydrogenase
MKESINIAIVGMGNWGNHLLEQALKIEEMQVKYICCRKKDEVKLPCNSSIVFSTDSICEDDSIKGVIIATQPEKHYEAVSPFLKHGISAFIEKPLAMTHSDCQKIIDLAERHSSCIMVGDKYVYSTAINAMMKFMHSNDFTIESISSRWLKSANIQTAGIFLDLMYHHVYLCNYLLSSRFDLLEKYTLNYKIINQKKIPITGVVLLRYGQVVCSIEATYNNHYNFFDHSMRIETQKGVFVVKENDRKISIFLDPKGCDNSFEFREKNESCVVEELRAFANLIVNRTLPRVSLQDDYQIVKFLEGKS